MKKTLYGLLASILFFVALVMVFISCNGPDKPATDGSENPNTEPLPPTIPFTVVRMLPHDQGFFTEGLEFHEGQLYESSGSGSAGDKEPGAYPSAFGVVDLQTGK